MISDLINTANTAWTPAITSGSLQHAYHIAVHVLRVKLHLARALRGLERVTGNRTARVRNLV